MRAQRRRGELMPLHWVQVEKEFVEGPELSNTALALGLSEDELLGKMTRLWAWSLNHATPPEGTVAGAAAGRALARAAGFTGDVEVFVDALVGAGVLEVLPGMIRFKGWAERYGKVLREQDQDAERKREERRVGKSGRKSSKRSTRTSARTSVGRPPADPTESFSRDRPKTTRPETSDATLETREVRSESSDHHPPAEVVVEQIRDRDLTGLPVMREVAVVRWEPSAIGCWQAFQLIREHQGLSREAAIPAGFGAWAEEALAEVGPGAIERTFRGYLADPGIRAEGHPTAVFIAGVWDARKPAPAPQEAP